MPRISYVNRSYLPHGEAAVHIEDRGFLFADGVYEVIAIHGGKLIDEDGHNIRLWRSLKELRIDPPMSERALGLVMREVIRRNHVYNGNLYLQITRGVARRDHAFPTDPESSLVMIARPSPKFDIKRILEGADVITIPDIRWQRRDIKSVSLLPNCLGKQEAKEAGAYEAWMVESDGMVTEGTSSNAWIVTADGDLVTRNTNNDILNGITRQAILQLAKAEGIKFVERPFSVEEALSAREAFLSSTTSFVKPVVRIDGTSIGNGNPGSLTTKLLEAYARHMDDQA